MLRIVPFLLLSTVLLAATGLTVSADLVHRLDVTDDAWDIIVLPQNPLVIETGSHSSRDRQLMDRSDLAAKPTAGSTMVTPINWSVTDRREIDQCYSLRSVEKETAFEQFGFSESLYASPHRANVNHPAASEKRERLIPFEDSVDGSAFAARLIRLQSKLREEAAKCDRRVERMLHGARR